MRVAPVAPAGAKPGTIVGIDHVKSAQQLVLRADPSPVVTALSLSGGCIDTADRMD
jgi:hypothetical protein